MLALVACASMVELFDPARHISDMTLISSALAAGHGAGHGNGIGNGNGNGGENGNGIGHGIGDGGGADNASGQRGDDGDDKSIPPGQFQQDSSVANDSWLGGKKPELSDYKENWGDYLGRGLHDSFGLDKIERDLKIKGMEEGGQAPERGGRAPERGARARSKEAPQSAKAQSFAIEPGSFLRGQVLAVNLSPAGVARARTLGFQLGDSPLAQGEGSVTTLIVPSGMDAVEAMALLQKDLPAEQFQLNRVYRLYHPAMRDDGKAQRTRPATLGNGKKCDDDRCYGQSAIQWKDSFAACARDARIGVIDTDIDLQHPAFRGQKITYRTFLPAGRNPSGDWHGTGVLALLAGRSDSGAPGLIPQSAFFAASIFYAGDDGDIVTDTVSFLKALDWMAASGAMLVNMSFSGPQDDLVQTKIESMSAKGFIFAAAVGNDGPAAKPSYPAAYPQVIAVTAVTKELKNYPYANRGAHIDVAAPGVDIWTALPGSQEGYRSGTSFASPFATAVLAILPPDALRPPKDALLNHARIVDLGPPGRDPIYGRGLLQAPNSCQSAPGPIADSAPFPGAQAQ